MMKSNRSNSLIFRGVLVVIIMLLTLPIVYSQALPLKHYSTTDGLPDASVTKIIQDSRGYLWFGTSNGFCRFDGFTFKVNNKLPNEIVNRMTNVDKEKPIIYGVKRINTWIKDHNGNIWIGTEDGLRVYYKGEVSNPAIYTAENGLLSDTILSLFEDREGNIWIGTRVGVSCLKPLRIMSYSMRDGLSNNTVTAIMKDKQDRLWIGTEKGLNCYLPLKQNSKARFEYFSTENGLAGNKISALWIDKKNRVWIGTNGGGLSVYDKGKLKNYRHHAGRKGLSSDDVRCFGEVGEKGVLIGTSKGLDYFAGGKFIPVHIENRANGKEIKEIKQILGDRQKKLGDRQEKLWISTANGIYRLFPSRLPPSKKVNLSFTATNILIPRRSNVMIYSMSEDSSGNLWFGTSEGVECLSAISTHPVFSRLTTAQGLPDNHCYFILEDSRKYIWIGTARGLVQSDGKRIIKIYSRGDGFPVENWSTGGNYKDKNGTFWLGSTNGLIRFIPESGRINTIAPAIYIEGVKVVEEDVPLEEFESQALAYPRNYIRFSYVGLCFAAPEQVSYKYRLEGIDDRWIESRQHQAFYPYLPPGSYRFRVKAVNNDGIESNSPAELKFEIIPPFWRTWWFEIIWIMGILAVIVSIFIRHLKHTKEKAEQEARTKQLVLAQRMELLGLLAGGAVHDLKNLLSIIIGYSRMVEKSYAANNLAEDVFKDKTISSIEKIEKTASTAVRVVRQILDFASPKPEEKELANLTSLLKDILDILNIIRPSSIQVYLEAPPDYIIYPISPTRFQQLILNLCINGIQSMPHGGDLKISLSRSKLNPSEAHSPIVVEVSDTGIGISSGNIEKIFDPLFTTKSQGKGTGLGLFVVKHIVDDYKGKIDIISELGKGTRFSITLYELKRE